MVRHAAAGTVRVLVDYDAGGLGLEIDDDGAGAPAGPRDQRGAGAADGSGIVGMRERARALGGELSAGPKPDGGFRVRARLPYGAGEPV
ncbi:ATP-binding protein [Actinomadura hibisca]|uniref:ATP-binding protein n=1 Tax=Actinomadura hibisca TaxID=68565 RepID=UPI0035A2264C